MKRVGTFCILGLFISIVFTGVTLGGQPQKTNMVRVGRLWSGAPGITVSVSDLMKEDRTHAVPVPFSIRVQKREYEVERGDLSQNPSAPAVSSWPPNPVEKGRDFTNSIMSPQQVGTSFLGAQIAETPGWVPPDIMGDVGPTQILIHVNGRVKVFDKTGAVGSLNVADSVFWQSVRNGQEVTDPHVRFDPITGRWFVVMINAPASGANRVMIAVSSGPTISSTSSFTYFQFRQDAVTPVGSDAGAFADYPTLAVDANAVYIGVNMFGSSFIGSSAFVINKSALLSGTLTVTAFREVGTASSGMYTPQGGQNDDATATEGYFIGVDANAYSQLDFYRVSNPGGTPTLSSMITITVPTTYIPVNQTAKGSTAALDAIDDRLFAAQVKKNKLTDVTSLWTAHNIKVTSGGVGGSSGNRNGSRWYELTNLTGTPTLRQSGTVYSAASSNPIGYWIPSVAMSGQGHMALGCSYASANDYTSIAVAGRYSGDDLGTTQSVTTALVGAASYNAESTAPQRWGDFTQTVVDPTDDMTMWTFQEYCNSSNSWALRAIKLIAPPPATPSSASPATVNTSTSNVSVVITGTSSSGSGFFDPGTGFSDRLSASVSGAGVTVNSVTFTSATSITLNINVSAGATAGTRTITVANPDGQTVTSAAGILTINNVSCPAISCTPTTVPNGEAGSAYSQTLTAGGGASPYTYAVTGGTLPGGITLSSGGVLSGTPPYGANSTFLVTATDNNTCTGSQSYTLIITGCPHITITPTTLPTGNSSAAYSQTITASGGASPYTYAVTSGSLPAGLSLSSAGALTGTPTAAGTSSITITATDGASCTASQAYSLTVVSCPTITVSPSTLTAGTVGSAYSRTITASGGTAAYSYTVTGGALPDGLSLAAGGVLSGTPTTAGSSSFTITATDANTCIGSQGYSLTINAAAGNTVSLTSAGVAYTQDFNTLVSSGASSTAPAGWLFAETGTNKNTTYAADSGSATSGNTYSYGSTSSSDRAFGTLLSSKLSSTIGAGFTNNTGVTISSLVISFTCEQWRLGNTGRTDSSTFGISTDATSLATGTWTASVSLNQKSVVTTGTVGPLNGNVSANRKYISATVSGLSITNGATFYIRWTDIDASGADDGLAVDDFSLTPLAPGGCPTIALAPTTISGGNVGVAYSQTITASGGTSPYTYAITSGTLPAGLSLSSGGVLSGTPATAGSSSIIITATDGASCTGNQTYSITIGTCPVITLSPTTVSSGTVGTAYSQTITSSGGTSPYTYAVTSGTLPAGLSLSSGGVLSGTPTTAGTSSITVKATDAGGCTGSQAYSLTINAAENTISLTSSGTAYTQDFNTLANSGTTSTTLPTGWALYETLTNANNSYGIDNGSSTSGNTFSYGTTSAADRAFGGLQSGTLLPTIGAGFTNNTGGTITSLAISYTGEEWRLGAASRLDSLVFKLSTSATSLSTGTWTTYSSLIFQTPSTTGTAGARDGNNASYRTAISYTITGLSVTNGSSFWIRWDDVNASGSDDGLAIDDFSLTPTSAASSYTITATAGSNGAISPNGAVSVSNGGSQAFTITANLGYHIDSVLVDGVNQPSAVSSGSYTFSGVIADHTIRAAFAINQYTISASAGSNGGISPSGAVTVNYGQNQQFTFTPADGYHVDSLVVDGTKITSASSYTFSTVSVNHTIRVSFAINQYTISASAGFNGSISPSGAVTVNYGQNQQFTFTPANGYHVDSLVVDGTKITAASSYTFSTVSANHTIRVSFAIDTYTITATASAYGSISPSGSITVNHGESMLFTATADQGSRLDSLVADGANQGTGGSYTFTNVTANHTIAAYFSVRTFTITASAGDHGSVLPAGVTTVPYGDSLVIAITPAGGYHIEDVLVDGGSVGIPSSYTFRSIAGNHTLSASFAATAYTISASAGPGGSITPSGSVGVSSGGSRTFTIAPSNGYRIDSVVVDGVNQGSIASYPFTNVAGNHSISAYFSILSYTIIASAQPHGSIDPSGLLMLNYGANQTFTITPDLFYRIDSVLIDGVNKGAIASYPMNSISADHNIVAFFSRLTAMIRATAHGNGAVTPSGTTTVNQGSDQSFTMEAVTGSQLDSVVVDGVNQGAVSSYSFNTVTGDHVIDAYFSVLVYSITASAGSNGSIEPSGDVQVNYGQTQVFTMHPATGYVVDSVYVDGLAFPGGGDYTFTNVTMNHTIRGTFKIGFVSIHVVIDSRWNLMSLPVLVDDSSAQAVYQPLSAYAYEPGVGYVTSAMLARGKGYWLKFDHGSTKTIVALPVNQFAVRVATGWNMIGSTSDTLLVNTIATDPGSMTTSPFFGYRNAYFKSDTIYPAKGYWVKVSESGALLFSRSGAVPRAETIHIVPTQELPPPPPEIAAGDLPKEYALEQNYPNPFNPATTIRFALPKDAHALVTVFNVLGQKVAVLADADMHAGYHEIRWDASNIPSGMFFYRLQTMEYSASRKLILTK